MSGCPRFSFRASSFLPFPKMILGRRNKPSLSSLSLLHSFSPSLLFPKKLLWSRTSTHMDIDFNAQDPSFVPLGTLTKWPNMLSLNICELICFKTTPIWWMILIEITWTIFDEGNFPWIARIWWPRTRSNCDEVQQKWGREREGRGKIRRGNFSVNWVA